MKSKKLIEELQSKKRFLMDGGMGSEIEHRGVKTTLPLWSAEVLLDQPKLVQDIHEDYLRSGAEIIITNTFRTTKHAFSKKGLAEKSAEATYLACKLAKDAVKAVNPNYVVYIAGSVAPLEDCYSPELTPHQDEIEKEHYEFISQLKKGGVDFILLETMITLRETLSGIKAAQKIGIPFAVSFCCNEKGQLLSGEALAEVVKIIERSDPLFIGVNCVSPSVATKTVKLLKGITKFPISVYAQGDGGLDSELGWKFIEGDNGRTYAQIAQQWVKDGAQIIGGCCGTTPEYIKKLTTIVKANNE